MTSLPANDAPSTRDRRDGAAGRDLPPSRLAAQQGGTLLERIEQRLVTPRPDCQIWTGPTNNGYGLTTVSGKTRRVHRVVWELLRGPIPDGLEIDHLCRVRSCCNVDHLEVVTREENARRSHVLRSHYSMGTSSTSTECPNGHPYSDENTQISKYGWRECITCRRENKRRYREKRRAGLVS